MLQFFLALSLLFPLQAKRLAGRLVGWLELNGAFNTIRSYRTFEVKTIL